MRLWDKALAVAAMMALGYAGSALGKSPAPPKEPTCGEFGTSVHFEDTPADAAKQAKKDEKLVMVLHVSGHFEDPKLT
jgi:hypothetical protein